MGEHRARRLWRALEPLHAVVYFAPEPVTACTELGTRGFWMSYFAQRAAPLGAAPPELVTATFHNFHPGLVARAVPDVWTVAPPERFLALRVETATAALRRLLGPLADGDEVVEAARLARAAALAAPTAGRALAAANAALPWPDEPLAVLWHAQTLLREFRGDGHVAALLVAGLDPVETLVLFAADTGMDGDWLRQRRGWPEDAWAAAGARLTDRGLLAPSGPTAAGRALRAEVEAGTDALADAAWRAVGDDAAERLVTLAAPLVQAVVDGGGLLATNPMGLRPLSGSADGVRAGTPG